MDNDTKQMIVFCLTLGSVVITLILSILYYNINEPQPSKYSVLHDCVLYANSGQTELCKAITAKFNELPESGK